MVLLPILILNTKTKTNYDFNWQLIQVWEYDFVETSYFGVKSKNLIASVTEGGERYTYEYTFDKDGYVTTIKAYDESGVKTLVTRQLLHTKSN